MKEIVLKKPALYKRFLAFIVDLSILNMILFPFDWFFTKYVDPTLTGEALYAAVEANLSPLITGWIFYWLLVILYFSAYEFLLGRTPGKALLKLAVVQKGTRVYVKYLLRSAQMFFLIPIWIIDVLFVFSKSRDRLFERLSKTTVVVV